MTERDFQNFIFADGEHKPIEKMQKTEKKQKEPCSRAIKAKDTSDKKIRRIQLMKSIRELYLGVYDD